MQEISFDERGLVPCIVQDWRTGEVLTLAYMNEEALERTRATGETHFWSRSRSELWHKGETSGNVQRVRELRFDCGVRRRRAERGRTVVRYRLCRRRDERADDPAGDPELHVHRGRGVSGVATP